MSRHVCVLVVVVVVLLLLVIIIVDELLSQSLVGCLGKHKTKGRKWLQGTAAAGTGC